VVGKCLSFSFLFLFLCPLLGAVLRCAALLVAGHGFTQLADMNADVLRSALRSVSRGATRLFAAGARGPDGL
jgi:hypothetical protein